MKIIAVGRNYADHAKELKNEIPESPVIFMKPDTALLKDNKPFYYPDFSESLHHEVELIIKIAKEGKHIAERFAKDYYTEIGLGIDFTARDLQGKLKGKGLPWELSKAFDNSAPIGRFVEKTSFQSLEAINFSLLKNQTLVQQGNTRDLIFSFDFLIAFISRFITLKKGDLIFTGTPAGVGEVKRGDRLQGYIENEKLLDFEIK